MYRRWIASLVLIAACGSAAPPEVAALPDLPLTDAAHFEQLVATSDLPMVVNVWASWCGPCRSEAPLLAEAAATFGDEVRFIGIDVRDSQAGAKAFIAEYDLAFEHYFDRDQAVPASLGGAGVPLTYFIAPGGAVVSTHIGIIDERTLALGIDELTR